MLSTPYIAVPDVFLSYNAQFGPIFDQKKPQFNFGLQNQYFQKQTQNVQKLKKPQRKRYRVEPRKAAMISTCPFSPVSSPVSNSPPPPIDINLIKNNQKNASMNNFLNSFQDHVPSCFDIVKRGNLPGIEINPVQ